MKNFKSLGVTLALALAITPTSSLAGQGLDIQSEVHSDPPTVVYDKRAITNQNKPIQ